jgi:hypothetical protein
MVCLRLIALGHKMIGADKGATQAEGLSAMAQRQQETHRVPVADDHPMEKADLVRFSCELLQVFETRPTISQGLWCALRR